MRDSASLQKYFSGITLYIFNLNLSLPCAFFFSFKDIRHLYKIRLLYKTAEQSHNDFIQIQVFKNTVRAGGWTYCTVYIISRQYIPKGYLIEGLVQPTG